MLNSVFCNFKFYQFISPLLLFCLKEKQQELYSLDLQIRGAAESAAISEKSRQLTLSQVQEDYNRIAARENETVNAALAELQQAQEAYQNFIAGSGTGAGQAASGQSGAGRMDFGQPVGQTDSIEQGGGQTGAGQPDFSQPDIGQTGQDQSGFDQMASGQTAEGLLAVLQLSHTLSSPRKFMKKYHEQLYTPYVIHTLDQKEAEGVVYLPVYMTPLSSTNHFSKAAI